jgi:hypothetical protein
MQKATSAGKLTTGENVNKFKNFYESLSSSDLKTVAHVSKPENLDVKPALKPDKLDTKEVKPDQTSIQTPKTPPKPVPPPKPSFIKDGQKSRSNSHESSLPDIGPKPKRVVSASSVKSEESQPENGEPENGEPENGEPENGEPVDGEPVNGHEQNGYHNGMCIRPTKSSAFGGRLAHVGVINYLPPCHEENLKKSPAFLVFYQCNTVVLGVLPEKTNKLSTVDTCRLISVAQLSKSALNVVLFSRFF